jgi:hypothetical protein
VPDGTQQFCTNLPIPTDKKPELRRRRYIVNIIVIVIVIIITALDSRHP